MITANARTTANLNPRLSGACAICSPSWQQTEIGRLWRAARQAHRKHRAFAQLARYGHVAAHHARELAGDGKAEAGAAEALSGRGIGPAELLEQLSLLLRSHADAGVSDRELDPVATVGDPAHPQPDLAFLGELAGIAQQIEQNLLEPQGIRSECPHVVMGLDHKAVLVLLGKLSCGADDLIDKARRVHRLGIEFELTSFDLREVQYLVDETQEVGAGGVDPAQRFQGLSVP